MPENLILLRRGRAVGAAALLLAATLAASATTAAAQTSEPGDGGASAAAVSQSYGTSVTIHGRGFGHGEGMGQWGAFGYASNGWTWQQILAHYYGNTTFGTGTTPPGGLNVRLMALDDRPHTSLIQENGLMATLADAGAGRYRSLTMVETANQGFYNVYGRTDAAICPGYATPFNPAGWTLVKANVSSSTVPGAPNPNGWFLDAWVPGVDPSTADPGGLVGLCQPDNSVVYYRGGLRVVNGTANENRTVNNTTLESYVRGVVPREMPASWGTQAGGRGMHALRAQAVAARSFALAGGNRYSYAKICDTQACQVYGGVARRAAVGAPLELREQATTNQAVADTTGVVLLRNGVPVSAMYSSSTGGITAGALFPSVVDEGDAISPHHRWTVEVPVATIQSRWPSIGSLLSIDVTRRTGIGEWGGRALQIVLTGTAGSQTLTGDQFRLGIGIKSTWIFVASGCNPRPGGAPLPAPAPASFTGVNPARVVDTRIGLNAPAAPIRGGCVLAVRLAGLGGVPATGASAVTVNLTVVGATGSGFATAYPCSAGRPLASNVNYLAGEAVPNLVTARLDSRGELCVYLHTTGHVILDVMGWFGGTAGNRFRSLSPARLVDTRIRQGGTRLGAGGVLAVPVVNVPGVPAGSPVRAVALNLTATNPSLAGFVTAYPCESGPPATSNLNFPAGGTTANQVVVAVGASGRVCLRSLVPTDIVVDLLGWFGPAGSAAAALFVPLTPARLLDSRVALGIGGTSPVPGQSTVQLAVAGRGGVPASGAKAVTVNLTSTGTLANGFVTAHPCGQARPWASNLNQAVGRDVANLATAPLGTAGRLCLFVSTATHLIADVSGYWV